MRIAVVESRRRPHLQMSSGSSASPTMQPMPWQTTARRHPERETLELAAAGAAKVLGLDHGVTKALAKASTTMAPGRPVARAAGRQDAAPDVDIQYRHVKTPARRQVPGCR